MLTKFGGSASLLYVYCTFVVLNQITLLVCTSILHFVIISQEAERKQEEERIRMENILSGNPLLNYSAAGSKNDLKVI